MGTRTGRALGAAILTAGVMTMTACGDETAPGSARGAAPTTTSTAPTTGTASPSGSPSGSTDLEARAKSRFVPLETMGEGWRRSQPPQAGFGLTVCGVDIEPEEPRGAARQRFARSAVGPFLAQHVQVHRDGLATEVVDALRTALATCTTFETRGELASGPVTTFTVDEADFGQVPGDTVVWRMTSQGPRKVTQDVALVADGEFLVGLVSYGAGDAPDPAVISGAVTAVQRGD
ncbi:hypothetical protein ACOCJ5_08100 [Knoellia sp. CPCC 206450]|uniref:hypothetical protein n=1 Tax=Knoellia tibetensis TaxID=3404798 RepID=UPI003B4310FB